MVPSVGEWVEFTYQKVSTFVNADMTDDVRLSNRYKVAGQIVKTGVDYILVSELRGEKSPKSNGKPYQVGGKTYTLITRCYKFERIQGMRKINGGGITLVPPQMEEIDNGTEV